MMRGTTSTIATAALFAAFFWPTVASAELRQSSGIVAELGLSVNGLTDDDYAEDRHGIEVDPLIGLSIAILGRPLRWFSAGVTMHYGFLYAKSEAYEEEGSGFFGLLASVRGHLPFWILEPWLGLGFGYALAHTYGSGNWAGVGEGRGHISLHGVGIGLDGGVGIHVTDDLMIGPFFRIIFGVYPTACYDYEIETIVGDIEDEGCDAAEDRFGDADMPHLWSVGLALSNTF